MEIVAKTWISPSKGTKLLLYRKDHVRSKLRPFHVKIMIFRSLKFSCRSFIEGEEEEEEENGENRGLAVFRIY